MVASQYRKGRVLAGDACHQHPPYGGFGLNRVSRTRSTSAGSSPPAARWGGETCSLVRQDATPDSSSETVR